MSYLHLSCFDDKHFMSIPVITITTVAFLLGSAIVHGFPYCSYYHATFLSTTEFHYDCYSKTSKVATTTFSQRQPSSTTSTSSSLFALNNNNENQGYKFGDITRRLVKNNFIDKVNDITGNEQYKFGDLSKYLDQQAKERITNARSQSNNNNMNTTSSYQYQFGDITLLADYVIKENAAEFAGKGKNNAIQYQFGDISKTILFKVQSGEYDVIDVFLALRVLLAAGFMINPIASLLPLKGLITLLNFGLKEELSGRVIQVVATEIDQRMKDALFSNHNNSIKHQIVAKAGSMLIGDITKNKLQNSLMKFTGKEKYEVGDILQSIKSRNTTNVKNKNNSLMELSPSILDQLTKWDQGLIQKRISSPESKK